MRETSDPKCGLVIMSSVRGRGRSIKTASTMRPRARRHHVDRVRQEHGLSDRVRDQEGRRLPLQADALEFHVHEVAHELVERAERLIEKEHR